MDVFLLFWEITFLQNSIWTLRLRRLVPNSSLYTTTELQILNRKIFKAWSFKLNLLTENQNLREDFLSKNHFFGLFYTNETSKLTFLRCLGNRDSEKNNLGKTYFEAKFVKKIKFNHFLVLINFWNEILQRVSLSMKPSFSQLVRHLIKLFTTHQISITFFTTHQILK